MTIARSEPSSTGRRSPSSTTRAPGVSMMSDVIVSGTTSSKNPAPEPSSSTRPGTSAAGGIEVASSAYHSW